MKPQGTQRRDLLIHLVNFASAWRTLWLILLILPFACKEDKPDKPDQPKKQVVTVPTPNFSADSAYHYVEKQVEFGPRVPGSEAHQQTVDWLVAKLKEYTPHVQIQEAEARVFDNSIKPIKNIIASFYPENKSRVLLAAHYDTRPFADQDEEDTQKPILGANDGGSGTAVLLEVARQLAESKPNIGVDIILFDLEDYGQPESVMQEQKEHTYCLGSQHWAQNKHQANYFPRYGILLDMVGGKNARFTMEGTSMQYAPHVVKKVWDTANRIGYSDYFVYQQTKPITDDHLYINALAEILMIDIIEYDPQTKFNFPKSWHTHDDNMDVIDRNTLKAVGQTLLEVVFKEG
jgi:glutaminyl-peptide cyclotransferase